MENDRREGLMTFKEKMLDMQFEVEEYKKKSLEWLNENKILKRRVEELEKIILMQQREIEVSDIKYKELQQMYKKFKEGVDNRISEYDKRILEMQAGFKTSFKDEASHKIVKELRDKGLGIKDIADKLGVSERTIRRRLVDIQNKEKEADDIVKEMITMMLENIKVDDIS